MDFIFFLLVLGSLGFWEVVGWRVGGVVGILVEVKG